MSIEIIHTVTDELVEAFTRLMPQLGPFHTPVEREDLEEIVASQASTILVARDEAGKIIGTLTLATFKTPAAMHAWIEDVVVDESARGHGVGEALTRAGIALAREKGAHAVELTSRPAREAANRLYRRLGFQLRQTNLYRLSLD